MNKCTFYVCSEWESFISDSSAPSCCAPDSELNEDDKYRLPHMSSVCIFQRMYDWRRNSVFSNILYCRIRFCLLCVATVSIHTIPGWLTVYPPHLQGSKQAVPSVSAIWKTAELFWGVSSKNRGVFFLVFVVVICFYFFFLFARRLISTTYP